MMSDYQRRLPIYLVLDCSESMVGDPLTAVNQGLQQICRELKTNPMTVETAYISVISFARTAQQISPLVEVLRFSPPTLDVGPGTSLGAALDLLSASVAREVATTTAEHKGDWKPLVFLLTDGMPTDNWREALARFKSKTASRLGAFVAVGCGEDVDSSVLREIADSVLLMRDVSSGEMKKFFKLVTASVKVASVSAGTGGKLDVTAHAPEGLSAPTSGATKKPAGAPASQVIFAARCRDSGKGYLMRYRLSAGTDSYMAENAYKVGPDYFAESAIGPGGASFESSKLKGAPPCPYCGKPGWALAKDGRGLVCNDRIEAGAGKAQVMFVLDITGSMGGEIEGVKENINDFMDYVKSEGLSAECGLIAFRDLEMGQPPELLRFGGRAFTGNARDFKEQVSLLRANGGGSNPGESSLDAIVLACSQAFAEDVNKVLILITDEPPLVPDGKVKSIDDVISAISARHIDQLHIVIPDRLRRVYEPLQRKVKGEIFRLGEGGRGGGAFRKVLLDIGKSISVTSRLG